MNKEELLAFVQKHAKEDNEKLNPDKAHLNLILDGLLSNKERYGEVYCPCRTVTGDKKEDKKKICPCFWHKQEIKKFGHCLCRLFLSAKP